MNSKTKHVVCLNEPTLKLFYTSNEVTIRHSCTRIMGACTYVRKAWFNRLTLRDRK